MDTTINQQTINQQTINQQTINQPSINKVLIVTSVEAERTAICNGLEGDARFEVILGGVGPASAAAYTAVALAKGSYDMVISMGIAGGFQQEVDVESVVVATGIVAADLGIEIEDGFQSIETLNLGTFEIKTDSSYMNQIVTELQTLEVPVKAGLILTLSTVTGSIGTADKLIKRVPGAIAEAMEGYGVATAARIFQLPVLEIRAISNAVGPRNREQWKIKESLERLTVVSKVLREVF